MRRLAVLLVVLGCDDGRMPDVAADSGGGARDAASTPDRPNGSETTVGAAERGPSARARPPDAAPLLPEAGGSTADSGSDGVPPARWSMECVPRDRPCGSTTTLRPCISAGTRCDNVMNCCGGPAPESGPI